MKLIVALVLFFISFISFMINLVGMHGHLMFRAHKIEDWIFWGITTVSFVGGLVLLIKGLKKMKKHENVK